MTGCRPALHIQGRNRGLQTHFHLVRELRRGRCVLDSKGSSKSCCHLRTLEGSSEKRRHGPRICEPIEPLAGTTFVLLGEPVPGPKVGGGLRVVWGVAALTYGDVPPSAFVRW